MSKYIDADRLRVEIEQRLDKLNPKIGMFGDRPLRAVNPKTFPRESELEKVLGLIDSLQQEQPMPDSTKLIELWHEDKEMLKEKDFRDDPWRLAYNAFMCGFGRGIAVNKQEQPEVDLLRALDDYYNKEDFGPSDAIEYETHKDIARHFYELGLNAREK